MNGLLPGECIACGAGRFRWDTEDGHQSFCAAVKASWSRRNDVPAPEPNSCAFDEGCSDRRPWARGLCKRHYQRWWVAQKRARSA